MVNLIGYSSQLRFRFRYEYMNLGVEVTTGGVLCLDC